MALRSRELIACTLPDSTQIIWEGFENELGTLRKREWIIREIPRFVDWKQPRHSEASHRYLYIREPKSRMIGRGIINGESPAFIHLDYLCQESNKRIRPPRIFEERGLTTDDIPTLLDLVLSLQPRRKKHKKPVDVIELRKAI
jgi:hypothetical protein